MIDLITHADINIRSPRYWLARGTARCRHCKAMTDVFGLGLPPGHESLVPGDEAPGEPAGLSDTWAVASVPAFIFHVAYLSAAVQRRVQALTRSFRRSAAEAAEACWANHCGRCDSALDDEDLFCEPDGAFLPTSERAAALIRLLPLDEAFEAAAGGYAYEPAFFAAMQRTELSPWLSIS